MKSKLSSAITYIKEKKESFNLRNIYFVWYQGENDNPNLAYEENLERLFKETKKLGVNQNFMIRIGHLYRVDDEKGSDKQKNNFNKYSDMIDLQTKFSRRSEDVVLVSTSASLLSQVKGPSSSNPFGLPKISDFMIDQVHFSQLGLNIIGSEAGYNTAIYNNTGKEADILDYEYKTGTDDFYYTGYDDSKSLTDKQSNYFYKKARKFVRDGNARGILQYGVLSKYKAYDLRTVYYGSEKYNGLKVIYMDKFKKGHYLGFDCSGFSSFIYHYVFGLAFDDNGKPWSTGKYIDLPVVKKYGTNYLISLFKTVGELKSDKKEYTLYSAKKKFKLQTGDMIIGRNSNNDAHIVIYIGKVKNNKKDLVLNSTSVAKHNIKSGSNRYNIDFAYLTEDNFAGAKNFSHEYKNITVLRLNNGVLPNNFIGNSYEVDFSKLNSKKGSYKFLPKVSDGEITEFSWINSYN